MLNRNKKAQVGESLTWIIATIIIIVILLFFILGASLLAKTKNIGKFKEKITSQAISLEHDLFLTKSLFTYFKLGEKTRAGISLRLKLEEMDEAEIFSEPLEERKTQIKGVIGK